MRAPRKKVVADPGPRRIELSPTLDIAAAAPLAAQILSHRGSPVAVDASAVERTGTQAVQVLLSAAKSWGTDEIEFTISEPSRVFLASIELIGLSIDDFQANRSVAEGEMA